MTDRCSGMTRRDALRSAAGGFGYLALAGLSTQRAFADGAYENPLAPRKPHFAARAKRVIMLFMQGGPTHVDTFDYKPELVKNAGKDHTLEYFGKKLKGTLLGPAFKFNPSGKSGLPISEAYPHLSRHADKLCLINGMHTDNPAHPQATIMAHTGSINFVRPSMGSWVLYGLGTENQNLPGFISINPLRNQGGTQNYGAAFLPASYQGTRILGGNEPVANIAPATRSTAAQRGHLDLVQSMNRDLLRRAKVNPEIEGVIQSYELAFQMQTEVPRVLDISKESAKTRKLYGIGGGQTNRFGAQCLMARRLAEAGVRFIEIGQTGWDHHNNLRKRLTAGAGATDQPMAGLLTDLEQRGLLKDTLVVWAGEFGRTPQGQNKDGRRHNNRGFTYWMAGGGVKGGIRHGATDPTGDTAVEGKVHTHDFHATVLHLLGLDHEMLTYRYAGRDFRLTDVYGSVVKGIIT